MSPYNATVVPLYAKSTNLRVKRVVSPGSVVEAVAATKEDGWADDSEDEEDTVKVSKKDLAEK